MSLLQNDEKIFNYAKRRKWFKKWCVTKLKYTVIYTYIKLLQCIFLKAAAQLSLLYSECKEQALDIKFVTAICDLLPWLNEIPPFSAADSLSSSRIILEIETTPSETLTQ